MKLVVVNLKLVSNIGLDHNHFFLPDINIYMRLDFTPLYSIQGTVVIALYSIKKEIIEYAKNKYKNFKLVYASKNSIYRMLYNRIYKNYQHSYSAFNINYSIFIFIIIALAFILTLNIGEIILNVLYFLVSIFKLITIVCGYRSSQKISEVKINLNPPIYTILVPLKHEKKKTIMALIKSLTALNYPKDKLDIKLIVEEEEIALIEEINTTFEIIKVPYSLPQTKAKACNYALRFAQGKYITVYDADDQPHPLQLQKVLETFQSNKNIVCVQVPLNYYNHNANHLTRFFTLEYSYLFDFALHGMNRMNIPILLGGSSNHFRIDDLEELGGWDPYNVAEDADLGIKLKRANKEVHILQAHETLEEAPLKIDSWIKQRARWIKGFIKTYLVHMNSPLIFAREAGWRSIIAIQFLIILPIIIYISFPLLCLQLFTSYSTPFLIMNISLYYTINIFTAILSTKLRKLWYLISYSLLMPLYHILHSVAGYRAIWQLFTNPYQWDKTEHDQ